MKYSRLFKGLLHLRLNGLSNIKGPDINLSEKNTKAVGTEDWSGDGVRAKDPIQRGSVTRWELEMYGRGGMWNFAGMVSNDITDFNQLNYWGKGKNLYGVDDNSLLSLKK